MFTHGADSWSLVLKLHGLLIEISLCCWFTWAVSIPNNAFCWTAEYMHTLDVFWCLSRFLSTAVTNVCLEHELLLISCRNHIVDFCWGLSINMWYMCWCLFSWAAYAMFMQNDEEFVSKVRCILNFGIPPETWLPQGWPAKRRCWQGWLSPEWTAKKISAQLQRQIEHMMFRRLCVMTDGPWV